MSELGFVGLMGMVGDVCCSGGRRNVQYSMFNVQYSMLNVQLGYGNHSIQGDSEAVSLNIEH